MTDEISPKEEALEASDVQQSEEVAEEVTPEAEEVSEAVEEPAQDIFTAAAEQVVVEEPKVEEVKPSEPTALGAAGTVVSGNVKNDDLRAVVVEAAKSGSSAVVVVRDASDLSEVGAILGTLDGSFDVGIRHKEDLKCRATWRKSV